ncbi:MAG: DUF4912 domain-containing protein [Candidatus Brocadiia bacterium]|jgi:hypothetical protein
MAKGTRAKRASPRPPYIDRGEPLPRSNAENRIVALVRSPEQIYLYWDVETEVRVAGNPRMVRVYDLTAKRAYDLEPPADADNWYLLVAPNRTCRFELFEKRGARLRRLAASEEVTTPIRWAGESGEYVPAEIVQAARHPISRQAGAAVRTARGTLRMRPAEGATKPARRAPLAVEAPGPDRPAGPPPTPIPVPWEKVFAAAYAGGK